MSCSEARSNHQTHICLLFFGSSIGASTDSQLQLGAMECLFGAELSLISQHSPREKRLIHIPAQANLSGRLGMGSCRDALGIPLRRDCNTVTPPTTAYCK